MESNKQMTGLTFRPACAADKARMLEITARTWGENGDYIPKVWDNWLADPRGELTVAELDGLVVALVKLTWQGQNQWWMEGLRVAPEQRLKGIGRAITAYQVELAKKLGGRVVRYATGLRNEGSHRIAERLGFHTVARFIERVAEKLDCAASAEVLTNADLDAMWMALYNSDWAHATNSVYVYGWKAFEMTRERLANHLSQGQVMGVRDGTGRLCAWCLCDDRPDWERLIITLLGGTTDGIAALARAMRTQAAVTNRQTVEALAPPLPRMLDALAAAGYHIEIDPEHPEDTRERGVDIFELRLDGA